MTNFIDEKSYGHRQQPEVFVLSDAIERHFKTMTEERKDVYLHHIKAHLNGSTDTPKFSLDVSAFATFDAMDAQNYIFNIFDNAISLGMANTDPKYGNALYVKNLVEEALREFDGVLQLPDAVGSPLRNKNLESIIKHIKK